MAFEINDASDLVDLSIQDIFLKDDADIRQYHTEYYNVDIVEDQIVKDSGISAVDSWGFTAENGQIKSSEPIQTFDQTYTQAWFTGKLRISKTMWKFGIKTRKLQNVVNTLKKSAKRSKEAVLANPLNNATSTSYTETNGNRNFTHTNTGGDGVALQSASHTREDAGANWSNVISDGTTNNMDFDYDSLKAARKTGQAILGPIGEILDMEFGTLICKKESSVHHRAKEILGAIRSGKIPGSADNDGNGVPEFEIHANPYLTSDVAWGMIARAEMDLEKGLQLKQAQPLSLQEMFVDKDNLEMSWVVDEFFQYGFNDIRNLVWSLGTNT